MAVTFLYESLDDQHYPKEKADLLQILEDNADFLVANTAKAQGVTDVILKSKSVSWPTGGYSCGKIWSQEVHNGVLGENIAKFVLHSVQRSSGCNTACINKAKSMLTLLEELLQVFEYRYRVNGPTGFYLWPSNLAVTMGSCSSQNWQSLQGTPLPYNMQLGIAQLRHVMWQIYSDVAPLKDAAKAATHEQAIIQLANYFKNALNYQSSTDSYVWNYAGSETRK